MRRTLWALILLTCLSGLPAAEIRDGQLWLEIFLAQAEQFTFSASDAINISEQHSVLQQAYQQPVTIKLVKEHEQVQWGLINRVEAVNVNQSGLALEEGLRESFQWNEGSLDIRYEKLIFESKYFNSKEEAEVYARQTGYPVSSIASIPAENNRVIITAGDKKSYFQLPLKLNCPGNLLINNELKDYSGSFILKCVRNKLVLTHQQNLEHYIMGVVPNEIGDSAPLEAMKAQAVAARSHAIFMMLSNKHHDDGYDLCNSVHCQVYKGNYLVDESIIQAVRATANVIMTFEGKVADAPYHSNCGGKTDCSSIIWGGRNLAYLDCVSCHPELTDTDLTNEVNAIKWITTSPDSQKLASWEKRTLIWQRTISKATLANNADMCYLNSMEVLERGKSGRIIKLRLTGNTEKTVTGEYKIRQLFGGLPSSLFYVSNAQKGAGKIYLLPDSVQIQGKGAGHGVGMCQVGAIAKARDSWTWDSIINFYYPGSVLSSEWLANCHN